MSAIFSACLVFAFEKIAFVDSADYFRQYDYERPGGCEQILDNVKRTGADTILWRTHAGAKPRYLSEAEDALRVEPSADARCGSLASVVGWSAEYARDTDLLRWVYTRCREREDIRDWGAHMPMEDIHYSYGFLGNWNLEHPQYFCRDYYGKVIMIHHSFAFAEYREHRLRLVREQLERGANVIYLDSYRYGGWRCNYDYVAPNIARWKELYPNEPVPKDSWDPRWVELCGESTLKFMRGVRELVNRAGRPVRFFVSIDFGGWHDSAKQKGFNWKRMVDEKLVDGVFIAGVDLGENRTYEEYERRLMEVRDYTRGKCACYFPIMAYNFDNGHRPSFAQLGEWNGLDSVASVKRLMEMAVRDGADGITMEVVDFSNYRKVEETIRNFKP